MKVKQASYKLTTNLRSQLKKPLGFLRKDLKDVKSTNIVCVGDAVSENAIRAKLSPKLIIFDEKIERKKTGGSQVISDFKATLLSVDNPAGSLSDGSIEAVKDALASGETMKIRVSGEEDLLALPAILYAPDGWVVVYGQPGEGVVEVVVEKKIKEKVDKIIGEMKGGI